MWFAKPAVNRSLNKMADDPEMAKAIKDNQILFHIYDDGSVEKKFVVD